MAAAPASLSTALERLAALTADFADLLGQERELLETRDAEAVVAMSEHKLALGSAVEAATAALRDQLQQAGLPWNRAGLERALGTPELRSLWLRTRELGARCAELNRANGAIIEFSRALNSTLLSLVRGGVDSNSTYTRAGRVGGPVDSRALARA